MPEVIASLAVSTKKSGWCYVPAPGHKPQLVDCPHFILTPIVIFWALFAAVPNQKEAAAIYLLPKLAHSDFAKKAQQIPTDAAKVMRLKLESWIADMDPQKAVKK